MSHVCDGTRETACRTAWYAEQQDPGQPAGQIYEADEVEEKARSEIRLELFVRRLGRALYEGRAAALLAAGRRYAWSGRSCLTAFSLHSYNFLVFGELHDPSVLRNSSSMPQPAIATAYRQLYRAGLKAVRYSTPQRHVLRWNLRSAFRSGSPSDFDSIKIAQTVLFLERAAASSASLEHKIVKNLLHVRYWEQETRKPKSKPS